MATDGAWAAERVSPDELSLGGGVRWCPSDRRPGRGRVVVRDVAARVRLLSGAPIAALAVHTAVRGIGPGRPTRPDGYWTSQVVGSGRSGEGPALDGAAERADDVAVEVAVDVVGPAAPLDALYAACVEVT